MRIADFPESTSYDESCYTPLDIDGATYKTQVENITPNVANNVSTTSEGFVWAARQGKLLKDRIDENTQGIAESNGVITQGIVIDSDPWILYQSRDNNTDTLYYPRAAKEILISVSNTFYDYIHSVSREYVDNAVFIPGAYTGKVHLQVAGWYSGVYGRRIEYVPISIITRAIGSVYLVGRTGNDTKTKVYYR